MGSTESVEDTSLTQQLQPEPHRNRQAGTISSGARNAEDLGSVRADGRDHSPWSGHPGSDPRSLQIQRTPVLFNPVALKTETLRLEKIAPNSSSYSLSFVFDATEPVEVLVHFMAVEVSEEGKGLSFTSHRTDEKYYKQGINQQYRTSHNEYFHLENIKGDTLAKYSSSLTSLTAHFVIDLIPGTPNSSSRLPVSTGQVTYANIRRKKVDNLTWEIVPIMQKVKCGWTTYLCEAIYGLGPDTQERGWEEQQRDRGSDELVNDRECVICLTEPRDTAVLPCRHLCLCDGCAKIVRMSCNKCPVCRQKATMLLQIPVKYSA